MDDVSGFYYQIGGEPAVAAIVEHLYARVLGNARLAGYFANASVDALIVHQRSFLTALFDGPDDGTAPSLREVHAGLAITDTDFDRLMQHLSDTLIELGIADELHIEAVSRMQVLRPEVVRL